MAIEINAVVLRRRTFQLWRWIMNAAGSVGHFITQPRHPTILAGAYTSSHNFDICDIVSLLVGDYAILLATGEWIF